MKAVKPSDAAYKAKAERLRGYASWEGVPDAAFDNLVRLGVVLDEIVDEVRAGRAGPPLLGGDADAAGHLALRAAERDERPRHPRRLRGGRGQRRRHARPAPGLRRTGGLPGLEQQLRRRGRQVHPVPLRPGAGQPDDRQGPDHRPRDPRQRRRRGLRLSAATSGASRRRTSPSAA